MGNEIIPVGEIGGDLATFDSLTSNVNRFLQRLQLFGSKSDACTEQRIGIGHWGLVNDDVITDLGEETEVAVLAFRAKALDTNADVIVNEHDPHSETFAAIRERSYVKDSGCMYGPEFLMYVPSQDVFATYFASSKTARREAKKFQPLMGKAATLKVKLIDPPASKYKWHGPVVLPCSSPLSVPDIKIMQAEIEKFMNPPKQDVEVASDEGTEGSRER